MVEIAFDTYLLSHTKMINMIETDATEALAFGENPN